MVRILFIFIMVLAAPLFASAEQTVWIDQEGSWPLGGLSKKGPQNLTAPQDFTKGFVYVRYEVLEKPTDFPTSAQICMWQGGSRESCAIGMDYDTEGVYYRRYPPLAEWWHKNPIDYTSNFRTFRMIHKAVDHNGQWLAACGGRHCYGGKSQPHIPIRFKTTAILTTQGHTFEPPADWLGCPSEWGCAGEPVRRPEEFAVYTSGRACQLIDRGGQVPTGFGAPYNPFSSAQELLLKAYCIPSRGADIEIGNSQDTTLVYSTVYSWDGSQWKEIEVSGDEKQGQWIVGRATGRISKTREELSTNNFFVAFVCQQINRAWQCGCTDAVCATPAWQLQVFRYDGLNAPAYP